MLADSRLHDGALLALAALYCIAVVRVADILWPGRTPVVLLAVPIVAASIWKPPGFVMSVAVVAIVVNGIHVAVENPPLTLLLARLIALAAIGFLGTSISLRRQKAIAQQRRHYAMIRAVASLRQPLTVIVGYTHLLRNRPDVPNGIQEPLSRICDAANDVEQQLADLLGQSTATSE